MQQILNNWVKNNPNENGYFTIVQHDDGVLLELPKNTIVYGACSGNIPIPLIYEDKSNKLENQEKISFNNKQILCSFVGTCTHNVRQNLINKLSNIYKIYTNLNKYYLILMRQNIII